MGQGYYRNVDDAISDPEVIAGRYQVGRNIFFEVALTLAEYSDNIASASGGSSSQTPTYIAAIGYEGAGGGDIEGCPEKDQRVWIGEPGDKSPRTVLAKSLLHGSWHLYNPMTRNYNELASAELIEGSKLLRQRTARGVVGLCSDTHKNIRNTADLTGTFLTSIPISGETLTVSKMGKGQFPMYQDHLFSVEPAGQGDVVKIMLKTEFIYAMGENADAAILSHNRKIDEVFGF